MHDVCFEFGTWNLIFGILILKFGIQNVTKNPVCSLNCH